MNINLPDDITEAQFYRHILTTRGAQVRRNWDYIVKNVTIIPSIQPKIDQFCEEIRKLRQAGKV